MACVCLTALYRGQGLESQCNFLPVQNLSDICPKISSASGVWPASTRNLARRMPETLFVCWTMQDNHDIHGLPWTPWNPTFSMGSMDSLECIPEVPMLPVVFHGFNRFQWIGCIEFHRNSEQLLTILKALKDSKNLENYNNS